LPARVKMSFHLIDKYYHTPFRFPAREIYGNDMLSPSPNYEVG